MSIFPSGDLLVFILTESPIKIVVKTASCREIKRTIIRSNPTPAHVAPKNTYKRSYKTVGDRQILPKPTAEWGESDSNM